MKHLLKTVWLVTLSTLLSLSAFSQNWNPFPQNQKSLYSNNYSYEDVRVDSMKIVAGSTIYYFNNRIHNNFCYDANRIKDEFYKGYFLVPKFMVCSKKSAYFYDPLITKNPLMELKLDAKISDTWFIGSSNLYFKCDSILVKDVFGEMDSVKYFNVYHVNANKALPNLNFALSKNFGLLSFSSIPKLAIGDTTKSIKSKLVGFNLGTNRKGYVMPLFEDLFQLSSSDVLIWKSSVDEFKKPEIISYYKDSIISVTKNTDSIVYKIIRTINGRIDTLDLVYVKDLIESFLILNPANVVFSDFNIFSLGELDEYSHWKPVIRELNPNYSRISFSWRMEFHKKNSCLISNDFGIGQNIEFDTKLGIVLYDTITLLDTYNRKEVVGSIIDGVASGISAIPLNTELKLASGITIYPNPVNCCLYLSDLTKLQSYRLLDLNGRELKTDYLINNYIDVSDLADGIYFLELTLKDSSTIYQKIIHMKE